jgi:uroporphyrinogen-III synthase
MQTLTENGPKKLNQIQNILISQPRPENEKSPYFDLAKKFNVNIEFESFIRVEAVSSKEFRKQKIDIATYTAVIFTSRNSIDHFFRICEEMRITISPETKYFCVTESVALYLQKFILYRKRKVFFGADGTNKSLFNEINKFKAQERFLYPCSENFDSEITNWLISNKCDYAIPVLYKVISNDVKQILKKQNYQIICFFTPLGVKSFIENCPDYNQDGTLIGVFGDNTFKAVTKAGFHPDIIAPQRETPSMVAALEQFLLSLKKK